MASELAISYEKEVITDPFTPEYWGEVIELGIERCPTPVFNLPDRKSSAKIISALQTAAEKLQLDDAVNPNPEGFRFHPESEKAGSIVLYDIERLSDQEVRESVFLPRIPWRNRISTDVERYTLIGMDSRELLAETLDASCPAPSVVKLSTIDLPDKQPKAGSHLVLNRLTYTREVGLGLVYGPPGRHGLLTFYKELLFGPGLNFHWPASNYPAIVGYSTRRKSHDDPTRSAVVTERLRSFEEIGPVDLR